MNKISIVIPVYNTKEELLINCINSAINQTYSNIEILIVDDGSDNICTVNICQKYVTLDNRVKVFVQKNMGELGARKRGVIEATGEFIMFLDSDDSLCDDACEYLCKLMIDNDCEFAEASAKEEIGNNVKKIINTKQEKVAIREGTFNLLDDIILGCAPPMSWSVWGKIYKCKIMKQTVTNNYNIYRGGDVLTLAMYISQINKSVHSNRVVYCYNKGNIDSVTAQKNDVRNLTMLIFWNEMVKLYEINASMQSIKHVKAIYTNCLAGCLLECKYRKYPNYINIIKDIKTELRKYKKEILFNKYMENRMKNIIVLYFPYIFDFYWWLRNLNK